VFPVPEVPPVPEPNAAPRVVVAKPAELWLVVAVAAIIK
jgi:hypothetical protein